MYKKNCIRKTLNLSTDADSSTVTNYFYFWKGSKLFFLLAGIKFFFLAVQKKYFFGRGLKKKKLGGSKIIFFSKKKSLGGGVPNIFFRGLKKNAPYGAHRQTDRQTNMATL